MKSGAPQALHFPIQWLSQQPVGIIRSNNGAKTPDKRVSARLVTDKRTGRAKGDPTMLLNGYAAEKIAQDKMRETRLRAENNRLAAAFAPDTSTRTTVMKTVIAVAGLIAAVLIDL